MPELTFKGKEFVFNHHLSVPICPLDSVEEKSVGQAATDGNLVIHGDNLVALKALLPMYAGKIDLVFIDPPYNTGNEGWSYNDNVNSPIMQEWLASNPVNQEDMLRHDKWLCMMWPRLKLLHELLSERGSLWITLDDSEQHRARAILDEIFGSKNFVANIAWRARESVQNDTDISINNLNHVIGYAKNRRQENRRLKESNASIWYSAPGFVFRPLGLDYSRYSNPDNDPRGDWKADPFDAPGIRENLTYPIENPNTGVIYEPAAGRCWRTGPKEYQMLLEDGRILFGKTGNAGPQLKVFSFEKEDFGEIETSWWDGPATTTDGIKELRKIIPDHDFDNPKPSLLVQKIIQHTTDKDSVILDSFAGSGTTAHSVLLQNAEDGGNRKFILVEGEDYADTLTAERVRRVINGYTFKGKQKVELLRRNISWTRLKNAASLLKEVEELEEAQEGRFDRISHKVDKGELIVAGEHDVDETTEGLGGTFAFCELGKPLEMDEVLTGENLPAVASLASLLYHTASSLPYDASSIELDALGPGHNYVGEANGVHYWLIYAPDIEFLKSPDAALTLSKARVVSEAKTGYHVVFAPSRFVSQKLLRDEKLAVEFAPLPFALYRIQGA